MKKLVPVILCGGSGRRLWPISRQDTPKQFLRLMGEMSLFQTTVQRALRVTGAAPQDLIVVSLEGIFHETLRHLQDIDPALTQHIVAEPEARNTAAAFALAALYVQKHFGPDSILLVLPSDHHIGREDMLREALNKALPVAESGYMVTFGTVPTRPETGYGYVAKGIELTHEGAWRAKAFVEKPSLAQAEELVVSEEYLWSKGVHMFSASTVLHKFRLHAPRTLNVVEKYFRDPEQYRDHYREIPEEPFEKAVLEKAAHVAVVPCDVAWSDIGSWESLWQVSPKNANGNVTIQEGAGRVLAHKTSNCLIRAHDRLVACVGLEDIVVIETADTVLVANKKSSESIKTVASALQKIQAPEAVRTPRRDYAWGYTEIVHETPDMQMREVIVYPQGLHRVNASEHRHWVVVSGTAQISLGDTQRVLGAQDAIDIPVGSVGEVFNDSGHNLRLYEFLYRREEEEQVNIRMAAE